MLHLFATGCKFQGSHPVVMADGDQAMLIFSSAQQTSWTEFRGYLVERAKECCGWADFIGLLAAANLAHFWFSTPVTLDWRRRGNVGRMYDKMTGKTTEAPLPATVTTHPSPGPEPSPATYENRERQILEILVSLGKLRQSDVDQVRVLVHSMSPL